MISAVAKAAQYLEVLRPGLLENSTSPDGPPVVRPLPLALGDAKAGQTCWWKSPLQSIKQAFWRKCFSFAPLIVGGADRAFIVPEAGCNRGCAASRALGVILVAIWEEVNGMAWHLLQASWVVEDHLIVLLEQSWLGQLTYPLRSPSSPATTPRDAAPLCRLRFLPLRFPLPTLPAASLACCLVSTTAGLPGVGWDLETTYGWWFLAVAFFL